MKFLVFILISLFSLSSLAIPPSSTMERWKFSRATYEIPVRVKITKYRVNENGDRIRGRRNRNQLAKLERRHTKIVINMDTDECLVVHRNDEFTCDGSVFKHATMVGYNEDASMEIEDLVSMINTYSNENLEISDVFMPNYDFRNNRNYSSILTNSWSHDSVTLASHSVPGYIYVVTFKPRSINRVVRLDLDLEEQEDEDDDFWD